MLRKQGCANSAAGQQGRGQLSISWRTPSPDLAGSYQVTLGSASGRGPLPVCMLPIILETYKGMWDDSVLHCEKNVLHTGLNLTARIQLTGVICWSLTHALAGYSASNVSCEATDWTYNTLRLLTVICLSIMVSLTCIERMTKAVSVSLDANNSSFVSSYVTMSCCSKHRSVLEESSLPLRTC